MVPSRNLAAGADFHTDPFATPSQVSVRSENFAASARQTEASIGNGRASGSTMEMYEGPYARGPPPAPKKTFAQKWRQMDERAYAATLGRLRPMAARSARNEKALAASPEAALYKPRGRTRAFRCSLILCALLALIVVIIAVVVPVALHFTSHRGSNGSNSAGPGIPSSGSNNPQPQNSNIVQIAQGQLQGSNQPNGITSFLGIQYAAPPTGNLRFAAPQPPVNHTNIQAATRYAPACHGLGDFNPSENEDCLYLDIFTPTNATSSSKLPVYVFIQGGGLQTSATHFNGSSLILASGLQMLTVTMTYRVNAFGFLASSQLQNNASLNNGLKDQRQALQWVQQNIAQFGGDPNHVILAGQSGGAGSAVVQMVAYGGRDDHLFQAAAIQSQSIQAVRDVPTSQFQYDYIVGNTSCHSATDTLSCLRGLSAQQLVGAITNSPFPDGAGGDPVYPYNPVLDSDFFREYPIDAFSHGHFVNVPTIFGDDTDEGTIFVPKNSIQNQQDSEDFLRDTFPRINSSMLATFDSLYNLSDTTSAPQPYWLHVASAYGEMRYTCPGIQLSNHVQTNNSKVWNYRYDVPDPATASTSEGVVHGAEMPAIWGPANGPQSYQASEQNANVVPLMQRYWTSFIKHLDPNVERESGASEWTTWTGNNRLHITVNSTAMENVDSGQAKRCSFLNSIATDIGQ